jgi:hypothetical protein
MRDKRAERPGSRRHDGVPDDVEYREAVEAGRARFLAKFLADPRSHQLEFAVCARREGWDETHLREIWGPIFEESDFEMLMAIRPDVRDLDGDVIEHGGLERSATAVMVRRSTN